MGSKRQGYVQLTLSVREEISCGLAQGMKQSAVASQRGYSSCTISREIARYSVAEVGYRAHWAQARADDTAKR